MSLLTDRDVEVMNFGEAYLVNSSGYEYDSACDGARYCSKCGVEIINLGATRCPGCKAFLG